MIITWGHIPIESTSVQNADPAQFHNLPFQPDHIRAVSHDVEKDLVFIVHAVWGNTLWHEECAVVAEEVEVC